MTQEAKYNGSKLAVGDMTKREYFAALAMQGILTAGTFNYNDYNNAAEKAVKATDALLNELNKQP